MQRVVGMFVFAILIELRLPFRLIDARHTHGDVRNTRTDNSTLRRDYNGARIFIFNMRRGMPEAFLIDFVCYTPCRRRCLQRHSHGCQVPIRKSLKFSVLSGGKRNFVVIFRAIYRANEIRISTCWVDLKSIFS